LFEDGTRIVLECEPYQETDCAPTDENACAAETAAPRSFFSASLQRNTVDTLCAALISKRTHLPAQPAPIDEKTISEMNKIESRRGGSGSVARVAG
jgi:hypothetical protein